MSSLVVSGGDCDQAHGGGGGIPGGAVGEGVGGHPAVVCHHGPGRGDGYYKHPVTLVSNVYWRGETVPGQEGGCGQRQSHHEAAGDGGE